MRGLLFFFVMLLFGWYAFSGYWYNCKIKDRCNPPIEKTEPYAVPVEKEEDRQLKTTDKKTNTIGVGDVFMHKLTPLYVTGYQFKNGQPKGNIYFNTDSTTMATPIINDLVSPDLKELVDHIKRNPQNKLQVTGYYTNQETKNYKGVNLGLERANNVRDYLVKTGLNINQIETKSLQNNNLKVVNQNVVGAINLSLKAEKKSEIVTKPTPKPSLKVAKAIEAETKTVYFKYNSSEIIITKELEDYVERLKLYLKQNATKKIAVTGHTDSFGNRNQNIKLGLKRADFVKQFLLKNGLSSKQIVTDSKGPDKPITSNKTAEGRKENRRVEITFN